MTKATSSLWWPRRVASSTGRATQIELSAVDFKLSATGFSGVALQNYVVESDCRHEDARTGSGVDTGLLLDAYSRHVDSQRLAAPPSPVPRRLS